MGRRSSIEQLPEDILIGVNAKLEEGFTLDQIMGWLEELGHEDDVSRSSLGRYKIRQDELSGQLKHSRIIAESLAREIDESESESQIGRVAIEMLHTITMKLTAGTLSGRMPDFSPQEIHYLARSQKDMMSALDIDDKRRAKIRNEALSEAVKAVDKVSKTAGLTPETADAIRAEILGVEV